MVTGRVASCRDRAGEVAAWVSFFRFDVLTGTVPAT
jgi:hypothetical protein